MLALFNSSFHSKKTNSQRTTARMKSIAVIDLTKGQAFMGKIAVRAPVNALQTAITISITATNMKIKFPGALSGPMINVVTITSNPTKIKVKPSATHSMVRMRALSADRVPNPATTDLVGMIWEIPHKEITPAPVYRKMAAVITSFSSQALLGMIKPVFSL
jgi:hypothetical protein